MCVKDCPSWVIDETRSEQTCVAKCPDGQIPDENKQCKKCADINKNTPYLDGEKCVASCPYERPVINTENNVCEACEDGNTWKDGKCTPCVEANLARPVWN